MDTKPNKGRAASEPDREHACKWVALYRLAEMAPDGRYCVNPDAPVDEQFFICADDPEPLLLILACFAAHGKFHAKDTLGIKGLLLRHEIEELRRRGRVSGGAIQAVADKNSIDRRKLQRLIRVHDKK